MLSAESDTRTSAGSSTACASWLPLAPSAYCQLVTVVCRVGHGMRVLAASGPSANALADDAPYASADAAPNEASNDAADDASNVAPTRRPTKASTRRPTNRPTRCSPKRPTMRPTMQPPWRLTKTQSLCPTGGRLGILCCSRRCVQRSGRRCIRSGLDCAPGVAHEALTTCCILLDGAVGDSQCDWRMSNAPLDTANGVHVGL